MRSTDYDRTIMSAQANLAGLYPLALHGKKDYKKVRGINIQLVPIHTVPTAQDHVCII